MAEGHQFDRDVELLIYYKEVHRPSALLEAGKPGAASGEQVSSNGGSGSCKARDAGR